MEVEGEFSIYKNWVKLIKYTEMILYDQSLAFNFNFFILIHLLFHCVSWIKTAIKLQCIYRKKCTIQQEAYNTYILI